MTARDAALTPRSPGQDSRQRRTRIFSRPHRPKRVLIAQHENKNDFQKINI